MAPADSVPREPAPCSPPDSSPESYLLPTRPARRPALYASDTSGGVTPPSGPCLILVCIQPSPWARRSVGAVEHGGSGFLVGAPGFRHVLHVTRVLPERNSHSLSMSVPAPFFPFYAALVAVAPLVLGPGRLPLGQGLNFSGSPVPTSPPVATVGPAVPYCLPVDAPSFVYS